MNAFCYPAVATIPVVRGVLGNESLELSVFGFKPRIPLISGRYDNTEIDMRLGRLLVEAQAYRVGLPSRRSRLVLGYCDFEIVSELALRKEKYVGYQLIRGVLAAYAGNYSSCVFCDARRPDLIEVWFSVMRAVRLFDPRCRLKLPAFQELAGFFHPICRTFLR